MRGAALRRARALLGSGLVAVVALPAGAVPRAPDGPLPDLRARTTATVGRSEVITLRSAALGRRVRVIVRLPAGYDGGSRRYPVLYLLHGVPGRPDDLDGMGLGRALDAGQASGSAPMIVVMPTGGPRPDADTEWEDSALDASAEWGTMVWRDLVDAIDARYRTLPVARHRAVGGISMGGFGALNLALRHRDRFGAVTMWSGYVVANTPEVDGPIGSASWRRRSPLLYTPRLAASLAARPLAIDFYSGDLDPFVAENLRFHRLLAHLGIPHRFDVPSGGHTWAVWRAKLPVELAWVSSRIG